MEPRLTDRQRWMAVLARAKAAETLHHLAGLPALPPHTVLRGPEIGSVMVRGRAGGGGDAFNLGEMTVARCTTCARPNSPRPSTPPCRTQSNRRHCKRQ